MRTRPSDETARGWNNVSATEIKRPFWGVFFLRLKGNFWRSLLHLCKWHIRLFSLSLSPSLAKTVSIKPRLRLQLVIAENVTQAASVRVKFEAPLCRRGLFVCRFSVVLMEMKYIVKDNCSYWRVCRYTQHVYLTHKRRDTLKVLLEFYTDCFFYYYLELKQFD